jgi:adenine-specific DNA methylase
MFIAKWSPEWLAFERGEDGKPPPPKQLLDDRCLIKWETSDPENAQGRAVLAIARELIRVAHNGNVPTVLDPFAGGGSIPLEAVRLGCRAIANDYNPVAYLILRATCEFPQKYGKRLAEDVERWAKRILERARERIGHLYPPGQDGHPVVGYLWARTAPCSNPTCRAEIPLLRSLLICNKRNKRVALTMQIEGKDVRFGIAKGSEIKRTEGTMLNRGDCRCPICGQVTPVEDLRRAGLEGKMGERMVAVIVDTPEGKDYRPVEPTDLEAFEQAKRLARDVERPSELILPEITGNDEDIANSTGIRVHLYGMKTWGSLFNPRQLLAMQTFVEELRRALRELERQEPDSDYRQALAAYLGLWVSRIAMRGSNVGIWHTSGEKIEHPFGRQAIPMVWDYPETNPFNEATGGALGQIHWITRFIEHESPPPDLICHPADVFCRDGARLPLETESVDVVVTDPPYFDQIAYGDLSDFFYVWLKRGLGDVFPEVFATPLTPKGDEATALKHRHEGDAHRAEEHFVSKLAECFAEAKRICKPGGIHAVMFAHQSTKAWAALVNALFQAGLTITATYPIETELTTALKREKSALESSITVICRPREVGAAASFRQVRREIERVVAESAHRFFEYGFRGADLIVACYGPAVGVFGRYERVERADGTRVEVPELLELAKVSALKAIAGEFQGDALSRLYFVWANLYGIGEQAWDDARLVVQIGGEGEDAMDVARRHGLFVVNGARCRLALLKDREGIRRLGEVPDSPLIDQLHRAMLLWKEERRADLVRYLIEHDLLDHAPFWKLAQMLFEVLPHDQEDWKLIRALLGERETLQREARIQGAPVRERTLFESAEEGG